MIERPDIDTLLAGPLGGWLQQQGALREEAKKLCWNRRFRVLIIFLPLAVFALILFQIDFTVILWGGFVVLGFGFAWAQRPISDAVKTVKVGINDAIAGSLGLQYAHDCEPGRPFELAKFCKLLPNYDRAHFEDSWSGHFGDIPFSMHEAKLEEQRGSGKNRRWVTVFHGLIMSVGYKRRFQGTTLLLRDGQHSGFFGGKKETLKVEGQILSFAEMAHPEFEDVFDIYTSDQVEARYLIDPVYVERLIALEKSYNGENITTIFHEGSIVVTLKTGNMFESGSIESRDDRRRIEQTIEQFGRLADLAATLNEPGRN